MGRFTMNQRVGILTGVVLFIGSMMTAYFGNSNLWAWVTFVTFGFVVWTYARSWSERSLFDTAWAAFLLGALSAFTARILGAIASRSMFDTWRPTPRSEYDIINGEVIDTFKVVLNGDLNQTLGLVAILGLIAAFVGASSVWAYTQMKEKV